MGSTRKSQNKSCSRCGRSHRQTGKQCKRCSVAATKNATSYYYNNIEKVKRWRREHADQIKASQRKYYLRFRNRFKRSNQHNRLVLRYGITLQAYKILFKLQRGKCAICRRKARRGKRRLAVDHCHTTRLIRGLLCGKCNSGIGMLRESPSIIWKALKYILTWHQHDILANINLDRRRKHK